MRQRAVLWQVAVIMGVLAFTLHSGAAEFRPVRMLLPTAPFRPKPETLQSPCIRASICLARYLRSWLSLVPGVMLVDPAQADAVFAATTGPAWSHPEGSEFLTLSPLLGVDVLLLSRIEGEVLAISLQRSDHQRQVRLPYRGPEDLDALFAATTELIANESGIKIEKNRFPPWPTAEPALVEDCLVAPSLWGGFMVNAGTARLELLRPHLNSMTRFPAVAATVINAALWLTFDQLPVERPENYILLAKMALPPLLGTEWEGEGVSFCQSTRYGREEIESFLLEMITQAGQDEFEGLEAELGRDDDKETVLPNGSGGGELTAADALIAKRTPEQEAGAVRCLGAMVSGEALNHFPRLARAESSLLRSAVGTALGHYDGEKGLKILEELLRDGDPGTTFEAAVSLAGRGRKPEALLSLARTQLQTAPRDTRALQILAEQGEAVDGELLAGYLASMITAERRWAVTGLLRLGKGSREEVTRWLTDPAAEVVSAVMKHLPVGEGPVHFGRLRQLASHPYAPLAEVACEVLTAAAPTAVEALARFELDFAHPYLRRRIVEAWAGSDTPQATEGLEAACKNLLPEIRALALQRLTERSPQRLRAHLGPALRDPHRQVRLTAAAAAARVATAEESALVREALSTERDEATRLYLADALARAEGKPLPAPLPAVHRVSLDRNQPFNCGFPNADLPYAGFYGLNVNGGDGGLEALKRSHAAGKFFLPRANRTVSQPAQVFFDPQWRDQFWLGLDEEFGAILPFIDGIVLGEESMHWRSKDLWVAGWRLFCREAGLDPALISGRHEKLSPPQQVAFFDWEQRVQVEAFNAMVDAVKLRYGKLRPGFQVATFLPHQNGPCAYDLKWRFDIACGYDYAQPNNRQRYGVIRRFKTLWPDRPVLWLTQGHAEMGISLNQVTVNNRTSVPTSPLHSLNEVSAGDSLTAWQAGAHTGLFAIYLFVNHADKNPTQGVWVHLEDLTPGSPVLERGLDQIFRGLAESYEDKAQISAAKMNHSLTVAEEDDDRLTLEDPDKQRNPHADRVAQERAAFRLGLLLEGRRIQNCVNLLAGLPFPVPARRELLVGPESLRAPGFDLPVDFDSVQQLNKLEHLPLENYRFIGLTEQDTTLLRDGTITALTQWLKTQPGLLYVCGWVSTEKCDKAFRADDTNTELLAVWPWEGEIVPVFAEEKIKDRILRRVTGYSVKGPLVTSLEEAPDGSSSLVYWQGAGWPGGVLFHTGGTNAQSLRTIINRLHAEKSVGLPFNGTIGTQFAGDKTFAAVTMSLAATAPLRISGPVLLTGLRNPELPAGRAGAFVPRQLSGTYAAAGNGVAVLCDQPIESVEAVPGGLRMKCSGLIRAVADKGEVRVSTANGESLPGITEAEVIGWLLDSNAPGYIEMKKNEPSLRVVLLRTPESVTLTDHEGENP